jgi:hypothetical protein
MPQEKTSWSLVVVYCFNPYTVRNFGISLLVGPGRKVFLCCYIAFTVSEIRLSHALCLQYFSRKDGKKGLDPMLSMWDIGVLV